MKQPHSWGPSLTTIGVLGPLILALGGWALSNSNRSAVTENAVIELKAAHEDDERRIEQLEIKVAAQSCHRGDSK